MERTDSVEAHPEQVLRRRLSRREYQRLLWWTGLAILAGVWSLANYYESFNEALFWMFGPFVISAPRIIVAGTLAGVGAWIACLWMWATGPRICPVGHWHRIWKAARITATVITVLVLLLLDGAIFLLKAPGAIQPIHVLSPASPGGCRLVLWRDVDMLYDNPTTWAYLKVPGSTRLRDLPNEVWINPNASKKEFRLTLTWSGDQAHLSARELTAPFRTLKPYPYRDPITSPAR